MEDRWAVSGTPHYMARALERHCGEVVPLGPARPFVARFGRVLNQLSQRLLGRGHDWMHDLRTARAYGRIFGEKLGRGDFDLVVAPFGSSEIAFLETDLPVVYVSDTTFELAVDYLPAFTDLLPGSVRAGTDVERRAIERADVLVYATDWAARSAVEDYGAVSERIRILPFGANLDEVPDAATVLRRRSSPGCRLLFVGRDWETKGGAIAVETLEALLERGDDATLTICGCRPPEPMPTDRVRVFPHLDKNDEAESATLRRLFLDSDFLLLPTRAEAFGIVFAEGNAFGLPAITTRTGGVPSVVEDGRNGYCLPPEAGGTEYAQLIARLCDGPEEYESLSRASRDHYERKLNWDTWGERMSEIIGAACRFS